MAANAPALASRRFPQLRASYARPAARRV